MLRLVMENAGLSVWPALSLLIFFITTLGVLFWIFRPGSSEFYRKLGQLALEEKSVAATPVVTPGPSAKTSQKLPEA
jgi:cbb3-type cytochrome oxidase subunit 3